MDENRVEGTVREYGGRFEEGVGTITGDAKTRAEGAMNRTAGAAQQLYGQTTDTARQTATTLDSWFRHTIETRPYTAAAVALGIGWLFGRMRRPL
jgi:uncharacterized protein YjbJ (UPF0337 family)